jgi:predicted SAM-dependent methyltransferase
VVEIPKLNIGCARYPKDGYINIDKNPQAYADLIHDIRSGLPYGDSSIDEILASHVLEHLTYEEVMDFLDEAYRVLKSGSPLYLVVPIMEMTTIDHKTFYGKGSLDFLWDKDEWWYHNRKFKWTLADNYFTQSNGFDIINIKVEALK